MQWRRTQDSVQRRRACTNEPQTCQPHSQRQGRLRSRFDFASAKKKAPAFLSCADAKYWRRTQDSVQRRRACTNEPQTCQPHSQRQGRLRSRFDFASAKKKAPAFLSCADAMQWRRTQDSNLRTLLTSTVFKTAALNHSANPPCLIILY